MNSPDKSTQPALRVQHVSKHFGGVQALHDVDFEVASGEVHCLAGENGCGKSTLIKIVAGVHAPEPGAVIEFFGQRMEALSPSIARAQGIAVIWQDLSLFPEMSVGENIAFDQLVGARPRWVRHGKLRRSAEAVLERLGIELDLDAALNTLPIAQRQIVAIARALIGDARMIFMDEPTSSLTQTETDSLLGIVRQLSSEGVSVVFVSHRLAEVLDVSSRVTVLRDGQLVGVYPTDGMTQSRLTTLMTGQVLHSSRNQRKQADSRVVMQVSDLSRAGEFSNISFAVHAGEVLGVTGLIGSGRTELAHVLFGMRRPSSGTLVFGGETVSFASNRDAMTAGIAYVSEDRLSLGLIQAQSIADNIVLPVLPRLSNRLGLLSRERVASTVRHWISDLAIKVGQPADAVSTLSGGNQQRVVLSKWLTTEPKLLILDSPTVGVDVGARAGVFDIVHTLAEQGLAIILISDEVSEVYYHADRILHMAHGQVIAEYQPADTSIEEMESRIYA